MCLGSPSYLLHPPALRSNRCADDLWRTTGPGRDPHPAGAPQRRLRKRLPRTSFAAAAAALVRTGDDSVLNNNTTTSTMRCQEPTKTKRVPHSFEYDNPNPCILSSFSPRAIRPIPHFAAAVCETQPPNSRLTGWQETCSQRVSACVAQRVRASPANGG